MNSRNHSFSFLMEFVIILFFFTISAMICTQIFTRSVMRNTRANEKRAALEYATNYIESHDHIKKSYISLDSNFEESIEPYYDVLIEKENGQYTITVNRLDDTLVSISFTKEIDYE